MPTTFFSLPIEMRCIIYRYMSSYSNNNYRYRFISKGRGQWKDETLDHDATLFNASECSPHIKHDLVYWGIPIPKASAVIKISAPRSFWKSVGGKNKSGPGMQGRAKHPACTPLHRDFKPKIDRFHFESWVDDEESYRIIGFVMRELDNKNPATISLDFDASNLFYLYANKAVGFLEGLIADYWKDLQVPSKIEIGAECIRTHPAPNGGLQHLECTFCGLSVIDTFADLLQTSKLGATPTAWA